MKGCQLSGESKAPQNWPLVLWGVHRVSVYVYVGGIFCVCMRRNDELITSNSKMAFSFIISPVMFIHQK